MEFRIFYVRNNDQNTNEKHNRLGSCISLRGQRVTTSDRDVRTARVVTLRVRARVNRNNYAREMFGVFIRLRRHDPVDTRCAT